MFGLGASEIVVIMALALIVFGPQKLPELAKQLARMVGDLRRAADDVKQNFEEATREPPPPPPPPAAVQALLAASQQAQAQKPDAHHGHHPNHPPEGYVTAPPVVPGQPPVGTVSGSAAVAEADAPKADAPKADVAPVASGGPSSPSGANHG